MVVEKKIILPKKIKLIDQDYIVIGLYLAEGNTYLNLERRYNHDGETTFTNSSLIALKTYLWTIRKFGIKPQDLSWSIQLNVNFKDLKSEEYLVNYWTENLGLSRDKIRKKALFYSGTKNGLITNNTNEYGCVKISFSSVIFRNFFLNFINKIFDEALKGKNKKVLGLILRGYFAGDGHVQFNPKPVRRCIDICCNDTKLFRKLKKALKMLGILNIKETYPETTLTHSKSIRLYNHQSFCVLRKYEIPCLIDYKKYKFNELLKSY